MNHKFDTELCTNETAPVHVYGNLGWHHTLFGWEIQLGRKVCVQKYLRIFETEKLAKKNKLSKE